LVEHRYGVPAQVPLPVHRSLKVQAFPSLHAVPTFAAQALVPLQDWHGPGQLIVVPTHWPDALQLSL